MNPLWSNSKTVDAWKTAVATKHKPLPLGSGCLDSTTATSQEFYLLQQTEMCGRKTLNFETKLDTLKQILDKLESGDELTLDESLGIFEEGITLLRECRDMLHAADLRIQNVLESDSEEE